MIEKSTTFIIYEGELLDHLQLTEEVKNLSHEIECWRQELPEAEGDVQVLHKEVAQLYCERDNEYWP